MITPHDVVARLTILSARLGLRSGELWLTLAALSVRAFELWVVGPEAVRRQALPERPRVRLVREHGRPL